MTIRDDDRAEARRLKLLSKKEQREIVEHVRSVAFDPRVPEADRLEAKRRGRALEELLGLKPRKKHHDLP